MTPSLEALHRLFEFAGALSILASASAWWRKGSSDEDDLVKAAADTVLSALSDADTVGKIDDATGRNVREQMSIEEAEALNQERELRGFGWRRN